MFANCPTISSGISAYIAETSFRLSMAAGGGRDMRFSSNDPVVLLHGTAGKPSQWAGVAAGLGNYEIRTPTLPGHGVLSGQATGGWLADEAYQIAKSAVGPGQRVHLV